jgi:predicted Zn finger-like uncharacterized protein
MIVECPNCLKKYKFDDSLVAEGAVKVRCRGCKHVWVVGRESQEEGIIVPTPEATGVTEKDPAYRPDVEEPLEPEPTPPSAIFPRTAPLLGSETAFRLRAVVLAMGECIEPPWWHTKYLSEVGMRFLERLYPRTAFSAGLEAAGTAARTLHDQSIGKRGVHHLFRLPDLVERDIRRFLTDSVGAEVAADLGTQLGKPETLLASLEELSAGRKEDASGPEKIGTVEELMQSRLYQRMAAIYLAAFSSGTKAFPYVDRRSANGPRYRRDEG